MHGLRIHIAPVVASVVAVTCAHAQVFVPPGLEPGDMYHLVFLTAGVQDHPTNNDIGFYNDFVQAQAQAAGPPTGADMGITYRAIASTSSVDARDNALVTAPVYRLDGQLVASGFDDLWDGSIQAPISVRVGQTFCAFDNDAEPRPPCESDYVWTGSDPDGSAWLFDGSPTLFVGTQTTTVGESTKSDENWIRHASHPSFVLDWSPLFAGYYALSEPLIVPAPATITLQAGDADRDLDFDQRDIVVVLQAGKYLSGQPATWGQGDWNGAPGGDPENPPNGDGIFDQKDIVVALQSGVYLTGRYAAIQPGGVVNDGQTSIIYSANDGELSVDAPAGMELTSINIDSNSGVLIAERVCSVADKLGFRFAGSFNVCPVENVEGVFRAPPPSSPFGSISFGTVAQAGLSEDFLLRDLTVVGSLNGGGLLGGVDLIYIPVPEPPTWLLVAITVGTLAIYRAARWNRLNPFCPVRSVFAGERSTVRSPRQPRPLQVGGVLLLLAFSVAFGNISFAELLPNGSLDDDRASFIYHGDTGQLELHAGSSLLGSASVESASCILQRVSFSFATGELRVEQICNDWAQFFGAQFHHSFWATLPPGLSEEFLLSDLSSFETGGGFPADLIHIPATNVLQAGDADRDFDFDQFDLIQVQVAGKYLSGQSATWGEGDWDAAPWYPLALSSTSGNGLFDQADIIAALRGGLYLSGAYAAIHPDGVNGDEQTSIIYAATTGEIAVDAPASADLIGVRIDSQASVFTERFECELRGASFDNSACTLPFAPSNESNSHSIFKGIFGGSFRSISFGTVAQAGLAEDYVLNDLSVAGALAGGGDLSNVDLIYVPEPTALKLTLIGLSGLLSILLIGHVPLKYVGRHGEALFKPLLRVFASGPWVEVPLSPFCCLNGVLGDDQPSIVYLPRRGRPHPKYGSHDWEYEECCVLPL